jgi:hypothetical protein
MIVRRAVHGTSLVAVLAFVAACVNARSATDTGNTLSPTAVALPDPNQPLAYEPDMRQLFAADCQYCHGGYRVDGRYSMNTYEEVLTERFGVADISQPGSRMFPYWSGNEATRLAKADLVRRWVRVYGWQRTR